MLTPSPDPAASRTLLVGGLPPLPPLSLAAPSAFAPPPPLVPGEQAVAAMEPVPVADNVAEDWRDFTSIAVSMGVHVVALLVLALFVPLYETRDTPVQIVSSFEESETEIDDSPALPIEMAPEEAEDLDQPIPEASPTVAVDPAEIDAVGAISDTDMSSFTGPLDESMVGADTMLADFGTVRAGGGPGGGGGGFGGEIGRRLTQAGAKTGSIQVSLSWNNLNDLDLHVIPPSGERLYFAFPKSNCGGHLDVDMNAGGKRSNKPVENVYWPKNKAPAGAFQVYIDYFNQNDAVDATPFEVHVLVDGKKKSYKGVIRSGDSPALVAEFKRTGGAAGASAGDDEFME